MPSQTKWVSTSNSPRRGILPLHFEKDGGAHGIDVWDSAEAREQFVRSTLLPAMGNIASARGLSPSNMGGPETTLTELHRLVR